MPMVNGKKYSYDKKGIAAAAKDKNKLAKTKTKKKKSYA
tara:strand:- start:102 stop:218 length:117 start_codon:yes stop_codon:yes gene_type:complete